MLLESTKELDHGENVLLGYKTITITMKKYGYRYVCKKII
jgi:hypothetical protein